MRETALYKFHVATQNALENPIISKWIENGKPKNIEEIIFDQHLLRDSHVSDMDILSAWILMDWIRDGMSSEYFLWSKEDRDKHFSFRKNRVLRAAALILLALMLIGYAYYEASDSGSALGRAIYFLPTPLIISALIFGRYAIRMLWKIRISTLYLTFAIPFIVMAFSFLIYELLGFNNINLYPDKFDKIFYSLSIFLRTPIVLFGILLIVFLHLSIAELTMRRALYALRLKRTALVYQE